MIKPKLLCKNHLLGEHNEIHKHIASFNKQHKIIGRLIPIIQIEPSSMRIRHDELVDEMLNRKYNHKSPYFMPDISYLPKWQREIKVDKAESIRELYKRCPECKKRIIEHFGGFYLSCI